MVDGNDVLAVWSDRCRQGSGIMRRYDDAYDCPYGVKHLSRHELPDESESS